MITREDQVTNRPQQAERAPAKDEAVPSPLCPCGEAEQDSADVLRDCRALQQLREELWPTPTPIKEKTVRPARYLKDDRSIHETLRTQSIKASQRRKLITLKLSAMVEHSSLVALSCLTRGDPTMRATSRDLSTPRGSRTRWMTLTLGSFCSSSAVCRTGRRTVLTTRTWRHNNINWTVKNSWYLN